jgi:signal transduction histidine kinase
MRLSIRTKLMSVFIVILMAMGIVGWRGIVGMSDINEDLNEIKFYQFTPSRMIAEANIALLAWNRATLNHVLAENSQKMDEYEKIMLDQKGILIERLGALSQFRHLSNKGKELVRKTSEHLSEADPILDSVVRLSKAGKQEEGRYIIRTKLRPIIDRMDMEMTMFLQLQGKQLDEVLQATDDRYRQGFIRISWIIVTAIALSLLASFLVSRGFLKAVNLMVKGSKSAAAGDFEKAKVVITSKDEFEYLANVFNQMIDALRENIASIESAKIQLIGKVTEVEKSNKALDEFAYIVSHDLREPLRGIRNLSSFLQEDYADKLDSKGLSRLNRLMQLTQRLEHFIESILYYSRIGRTELSCSMVDLNSVVSETMDTLKFSLEQAKVEICIPEKLPAILCDRIRMGEVFSNLITNAIKYNDKPDKKIEIGFQADQNPYVFYVRDNGIGIRGKHMEKIFHIFKRLHGRDKYGGGTGAGLTITRKIIERHGGELWVKSILGEGSCFYFSLEGGGQ